MIDSKLHNTGQRKEKGLIKSMAIKYSLMATSDGSSRSLNVTDKVFGCGAVRIYREDAALGLQI